MSFNFKFTHSVLNRLEADGLTPAPLKNLQALKDISFANEEFLLTAVMETVSIKASKGRSSKALV